MLTLVTLVTGLPHCSTVAIIPVITILITPFIPAITALTRTATILGGGHDDIIEGHVDVGGPGAGGDLGGQEVALGRHLNVLHLDDLTHAALSN
jgi:hypothetical protein